MSFTARSLVAAVSFVLATTVPLATGESPAGRWEGELATSRRPRRVELTLRQDDAGTRGHLLVDGRFELSVRDLSVSPGEVRFTTELSDGNPVVVLKIRNGRLEGTMQIGDEAIGLELARMRDYPPPGDRAEGWTQDLDVVRARFLRFDRSFTKPDRAKAEAALERLATEAPALTDEQVTVRLSEIVADSGNAHTRLYLLRNRTALRRMPIRVRWFSDGLFVIQATVQHGDLLGCRVAGVGESGIEAAQDRVAGLFAGNASWKRYKGPYFLTSPEILTGTGLATDSESIPYELECAGKRRTADLAPLPLQRLDRPTEAWRELSPLHVDDGWKHVLEESVPLYLRHPDRHYWSESFSDRRLIYFQYNRSQDMPEGESLSEFATSLRQRLTDGSSLRLVVDLRFNTGGNLGIARELFEHLATFPDPAAGKRLYLIVGTATFSAGIYHAAQLAPVPGVVLVGEPVGDVLDTWSEGGNLVLPNSGLTVHYTNGFHGYSTREYPDRKPYFIELSLAEGALHPHVYLAPSFDDYRSGVDPVLEAILEAAPAQTREDHSAGARVQ